MSTIKVEESFVTESSFTDRLLGASRRGPQRQSTTASTAAAAPISTGGTAEHTDEPTFTDPPDTTFWVNRFTKIIIAFALVVLFWKLHGFKLPSQIAVEKASANGKPAPKLNLLRSIGDWISPWRWGRGDLLKRSTPTGGDMGAHVFTPDFVRHSLFSKGRLTGWTDSSYAGMPVINFYFPLPTLLIAFLSFIIPYTIAFKLVTILGILALPIAAFKAGRLAGLRCPVPTLMTLAAVIFVLARNYDLQIYGGNILATMAGEFSFSISLAAATLFLGLFTRALRTGEGRGRTAVMLAITGLCHLLPTLFAIMVAFFLFLAHLDPQRLRFKRPDLAAMTVGIAGFFAVIVALADTPTHGVLAFGVAMVAVMAYDWFTNAIGFGQIRDVSLMLGFGGAIAGFWAAPFFTNLPYTNDMGWEKMTKYVANLFPFWAGNKGKPYADAGIVAVLMILAAIGSIGAWTSVAVAIKRSVQKRSIWSPAVMPVAVIVASIVGLVSALVNGSGWAGLIVALAIVLMTFVVYVAMAERSMTWTAILLCTAVAVTTVALLKRSSSPLTVAVAGIVGLAIMVVRASLSGEQFHRWPVALTFATGTIATLFRYSPQFRLWNARALPFWFFTIALLAAFGATELSRWIGALVRRFAEPRTHLPDFAAIGTAIAAVATFVAVGLPLNLVPGNVPIPDIKAGRVGVKLAKTSVDSNPAPGWAGYNFAGYEARAWTEYKAFMDKAAQVGKEHGCGRAMWEYDDSRLNSYGTTLALMLLPYWTRGCIGSMEAVYFESSATAPSHWLTAAMVTAPAVTNTDGSKKYSGPSNPQRFLRYPAVTVENYPQMFATGIKKLQGAAVKYYVSLTDLSAKTADVHPDLTKVASSGPFNIYEIRGSERVAPLTSEPVVIRGIDQNQDGGWLDVEQEWFLTPESYPGTIAWAGPKSWQRTTATVKKPKGEHTYGVGVSLTPTQAKPLEPVIVSNISQNNTDIRFHVDKIGVPVLVKTSFFPNWKASGAKGPYRVMPNFMVVVPTKNDVRIHYGYSWADRFGYLASVVGLVGVFLLHRRTKTDRSDSLAARPRRVVSISAASESSGADVESDGFDTFDTFDTSDTFDDAHTVDGSGDNAPSDPGGPVATLLDA